MPPVCLEARGVAKVYGSGRPGGRRTAVLRGVNLLVRSGRTVGITGESGAGKTTLGKILAGVERPSAGQVLYRGAELSRLPVQEWAIYRRNVQMLFQDPEGSLNPMKSVDRSLGEVCRLAGIRRGEVAAAVRETLRTVGLTDEVLCRRPRELSGGQNQRVALGRILLLRPRLIVLDEPTSALDVSVQAQILHLLKDLRARAGLGYLLISHDEEVARFMCDEVYTMVDGVLEEAH